MPDVVVCGVNDVFGSEMEVELQGKNIDELSADIWDGKNDHRNTDIIDVEKFVCIKKCLNSGIDEISNDIFSGRMVDVVDEFASEMKFELHNFRPRQDWKVLLCL